MWCHGRGALCTRTSPSPVAALLGSGFLLPVGLHPSPEGHHFWLLLPLPEPPMCTTQTWLGWSQQLPRENIKNQCKPDSPALAGKFLPQGSVDGRGPCLLSVPLAAATVSSPHPRPSRGLSLTKFVIRSIVHPFCPGMLFPSHGQLCLPLPDVHLHPPESLSQWHKYMPRAHNQGVASSDTG